MSVVVGSGAETPQNARLLYESVFDDGTITVSSQTSDGAGANALEDTTFDFWTPVAGSGEIRVDRGSDFACDTVGVAAHNMGTNGTNMRVQYSDDESNWITAISFDPLTDETIMGCFEEVSARYWRVRGVGSGDYSIGVVKLGKALIMPSGVLTGHVGINHAKRVELLTNRSVRGQFLGNRVRRVGADANLNFGLIDSDFVENDMAMFEDHYNDGRTFFYAGSPSEYPDDYGYCYRGSGNNEMRPSYQEGGVLMNVQLDVQVYVE